MQLQRQRRRWPLLVGAFGGYIAWDLIDHIVLQPRGLAFGLDWGSVGIFGIAAWLMYEHRTQPRQHQVDEPSDFVVPPAVLVQMHDSLIALEDTLQEATASISSMIGTVELEQQRRIRHALVALHQAQSLTEEINGLSARPSFQGPPPAHELFIHH